MKSRRCIIALQPTVGALQCGTILVEHSATWASLTAKLRPPRSTKYVSAKRQHMLFTGSRILSHKWQDYLHHRLANAQGSSTQVGELDVSQGRSPVGQEVTCAWIPVRTFDVLGQLFSWRTPLTQRDVVVYRAVGIAPSLLGQPHYNCGEIVSASSMALDADGDEKRQLLERLRELGRPEQGEESNAALGALFCADVGVPLRVSGKPFGGSADTWQELRRRMETRFPSQQQRKAHAAAGGHRGGTFRSPYWVTAEEAQFFGTTVIPGSTPSLIKVHQGDDTPLAFYNAEQTRDPSLFHSRSCNTSVAPILLPNLFFGQHRYRDAPTSLKLRIAWESMSEDAGDSAETLADDRRTSGGRAANVWVKKSMMALLGLTCRSYFTTQAPAPPCFGYVPYEDIAEQDKVGFLLRYMPCLVALKPLNPLDASTPETLGVEAATCTVQRAYGHNRVRCAKASFAHQSVSPYWIRRCDLDQWRAHRDDNVVVLCGGAGVLIDEADEGRGGQLRVEYINVTFSSL